MRALKSVVLILGCYLLSGCTVKAVGDPERPITIQAHVTVDVKGLQNTATNIEDYVRGEADKDVIVEQQGGSNGS